METVNEQRSAELLRTLVEKSWESATFKEQLISNPSKTISGIIGKELSGKMPNGQQLVVVDQSDESKFFLNIPAKPKLDMELNEEELEQVAGGATGPFYDAGKWVGTQIKEFGEWVGSLF